jgi:membrane carboxypeptidase/penicillin-binding protein
MSGGYAARVALPVWANVMKQMTATYPMQDFPVPPGLQEADLDGGLFSHGQRYYLTPAQIAQADQTPVDEDRPQGRNIFQKFFDIFR